MHNLRHHPEISRRPAGQWVVNGRECQRARGMAVPIGIGLPVQSQRVAEMLQENHQMRQNHRGHAARSS